MQFQDTILFYINGELFLNPINRLKIGYYTIFQSLLKLLQNISNWFRLLTLIMVNGNMCKYLLNIMCKRIYYMSIF